MTDKQFNLDNLRANLGSRQGKILVIKYGGSIMADRHLREAFAHDVASLNQSGVYTVIVHGGGKEISLWMEKIGKTPLFIEGLRYTDSETAELTEMVLSGKVNKELVSVLNAAGNRAVGLSGKDGRIFLGEKVSSRSGQNLGFVGDFVPDDASLLLELCKLGFVPVVSPIGCDATGQTLNLNADTVASGLATALHSEILILLTDVSGISIGGKLLKTISLSEAEELLRHPEITGGMLPKLEYSVRAIRAGVQAVHIANGSEEHVLLRELFPSFGTGTIISRNTP